MSGLEWKDTLVPNNQQAWNEQKADWERDALGSLPVLKLDGQVFYQTHAIEQWAGLSDKKTDRSQTDYLSVINQMISTKHNT